MFTGIIEKTVPILAVAHQPSFRRLTLPAAWTDLRPGESIAVNGCCLTIAELSADRMGFDVITETLSKTNLGMLEANDHVHLERALRIGDRLDGHFVQGHVDGTAALLEQVESESETRLRLQTPAELAKYLIPKGSVTLDGVSLTLAAIHDGSFEVALIPTTVQLTYLTRRLPGWLYNLEADILSKTIVTHLERLGPKGTI